MRMWRALFSHYYCHFHVDTSLSSNFCVYWSPKSMGHRIQNFFNFLSVIRKTQTSKQSRFYWRRKEGGDLCLASHRTQFKIHFKQSLFSVVLPVRVTLWPFPSQYSALLLLESAFCPPSVGTFALFCGAIQFWPDSHM